MGKTLDKFAIELSGSLEKYYYKIGKEFLRRGYACLEPRMYSVNAFLGDSYKFFKVPQKEPSENLHEPIIMATEKTKIETSEFGPLKRILFGLENTLDYFSHSSSSYRPKRDIIYNGLNNTINNFVNEAFHDKFSPKEKREFYPYNSKDSKFLAYKIIEEVIPHFSAKKFVDGLIEQALCAKKIELSIEKYKEDLRLKMSEFEEEIIKIGYEMFDFSE